MIKSLKVIFSIVLLFLLVLACSHKEEYSTPESVIEANAKYMTEENMDEVMNTIYKDSPNYASTESIIKSLFDRYDLSYKINSLKVTEETNNEAKVQFVQETVKISGPEFRNNRVTGIHNLKKDGDSWKIYSTEIKDVQYLN
jgi:hypothetical protein